MGAVIRLPLWVLGAVVSSSLGLAPVAAQVGSDNVNLQFDPEQETTTPTTAPPPPPPTTAPPPPPTTAPPPPPTTAPPPPPTTAPPPPTTAPAPIIIVDPTAPTTASTTTSTSSTTTTTIDPDPVSDDDDDDSKTWLWVLLGLLALALAAAAAWFISRFLNRKQSLTDWETQQRRLLGEAQHAHDSSVDLLARWSSLTPEQLTSRWTEEMGRLEHLRDRLSTLMTTAPEGAALVPMQNVASAVDGLHIALGQVDPAQAWAPQPLDAVTASDYLQQAIHDAQQPPDRR